MSNLIPTQIVNYNITIFIERQNNFSLGLLLLPEK